MRENQPNRSREQEQISDLNLHHGHVSAIGAVFGDDQTISPVTDLRPEGGKSAQSSADENSGC